MTDQNNVAPSAPSQKSTFSATIIMLVIAVVLISAIGTWAVLNSVASGKESAQAQSNTNVGVMSLNILPPTSSHDDNSGKVTLNITK